MRYAMISLREAVRFGDTKAIASEELPSAGVHEKCVGVLDEESQIAFALIREKKDQHGIALELHRMLCDDELLLPSHPRVRAYSEVMYLLGLEIQALHAMLCLTLCRDFSVPARTNVGIRSGFEIVLLCPCDEEPDALRNSQFNLWA